MPGCQAQAREAARRSRATLSFRASGNDACRPRSSLARSSNREEENTVLTKAYIPYGGYYSTPFVRWQGSLASENAIALGAATSKRFLEAKKWDPNMLDYVHVGSTVYQQHWFYSGPWAAALLGAEKVPGALISQACSTAALVLYQAAMGVETGMYDNNWCLLADRCSNGPH